MASSDQLDPERIRFGYQRPLALVAAVAGVLALFALIALATSAESAEEYRERQAADESPDLPEPSEDENAESPFDQDSSATDQGDQAPQPQPEPGPDNRPGRLRQDEESTYYYSDDDSAVEGLRVTPEGELQAIEPGEINAGDFPLDQNSSGGVSLTNPSNGELVELATTDEGVEGRSASPGSGFAPLPTTADGSVVAVPGSAFTPEQLAGAGGDPVVLNPPQGPISLRFTEDGLVAEPLPDDAVIINDFIDEIFAPSTSLPWRWVLFAYSALALASVIGALIMWYLRPRQEQNLRSFGAEPTQLDHFERVLQSIATDPDPTNAILVAFSVAERGIGHLAPRRVEETPFEWHHRLLTSEGSRQTPELGQRLGPVCDLYARARFAPGNASEADRQAMIAALRELHAVASGQVNSPSSGSPRDQSGSSQMSLSSSRPVDP